MQGSSHQRREYTAIVGDQSLDDTTQCSCGGGPGRPRKLQAGFKKGNPVGSSPHKPPSDLSVGHFPRCRSFVHNQLRWKGLRPPRQETQDACDRRRVHPVLPPKLHSIPISVCCRVRRKAEMLSSKGGPPHRWARRPSALLRRVPQPDGDNGTRLFRQKAMPEAKTDPGAMNVTRNRRNQRKAAGVY